MRIALGPILFLGFVQTLQAQSSTDGRTGESSETTASTRTSSRYRDPSLARMWPNRTGARIFASPIMAPELRPPTNDTLAEPRRRNVVRPKSRTIDGRYSAPSPVLLPPYKSYSPECDFDAAEKTIIGSKGMDTDSSRGSTLKLSDSDSDTSNGPSRGSAKYRTLRAHHWKRRLTQPVNHFQFIESDRKIGAIPGVPGRDYPVHQQHTHRHLRYHANRFLCPVTPGTHVYLADRASRCQASRSNDLTFQRGWEAAVRRTIFYVCYGEQTGVPMMCPNGTLFSEPLQVCDWWFNVAC